MKYRCLLLLLCGTAIVYAKSTIEKNELKENIGTHLHFAEYKKLIQDSSTRPIEAIKYAEKALQSAKRENNKKQIFQAYKVLMYLDKKENLRPYADSLITIAREINSPDALGSAYMTRGIISYDEKELQKALDDFVKADQYIAQTNNQYNIHKLKYAVANVKYYLGYYDEAIALLNQCEAYFSEENDRAYLNTLHALARCYSKQKEFIKSNYYNSLGLKESAELDNEKMILYFRQSEATNQYYVKDYHNAIKGLTALIPDLRVNRDFANEALANFYIGRSLWNLGKKEQAVVYFSRVDEAYDSTDYLKPEFRENYELLIKYYEGKNKELFLKYIKKLLGIEQILASKYAYLSTKIHREYDTEKLLKIQEGALKKMSGKKDIAYAVTIIAIILASFLTFRNYSNKKKYRKRFEELIAKKDNESHELPARTNDSEDCGISEEIVEVALVQLELFEKNNTFLEADLNLTRMAKLLKTNGKYASKIIFKYRGKKTVKYINDLKINYLIQIYFAFYFIKVATNGATSLAAPKTN